MPEITGTLRPPRLAAAPASPVRGQMYYDTGSDTLYWWNGTTWVPATGTGSGSSSGGGAGGMVYTQTIGDGLSNSFVVRHNLGVRNVAVVVYQSASPYAEVEADVEHTDANTVTVRTIGIPTTGQYTVVVQGGGTVAATMAARAYRNAALTVASGGWSKIPVDTISFDTTGGMQLASGRYVCPVAGYYQVNGGAGVSATAAGQDAIVAIYLNGASAAQGTRFYPTTANGSLNNHHVGDVLQCNANDVLELWIFTNETLTVGQQTFLSVSLISSLSSTTAPVTAARAYRSAAFTLPTSTGKIPLDAIDYDPGGNVSLANGRYVCKASGTYLVTGELYGNCPANGFVQCLIYKNGANIATGTQTPGNGTTGATATAVIQANAGDYFELFGAGTASTALYVPSVGNNFLSVVMVGQTAAIAGSSGASARMFRTAALTVNGWMKIPLDTVSFDTSGIANPASGSIQVKTAGYYQVNANVAFGVSTYSGRCIGSIYKNGIEVARNDDYRTDAGGGGNRTFTISELVSCNAGDTLELWAWTATGFSIAAGQVVQCYLSATLITAGPGPQGPIGPIGPPGQPNLKPVNATANYTAQPFDLVICNSGGLTITLPASPPDGTLVGINSYQLDGPNNWVAINGNGKLIWRGVNAASITYPPVGSIVLEYNVANGDWRTLSDTRSKGVILGTQIKRGVAEGYAAVPSVANTTCLDGAGGNPMSITYAPAVPVYWEVTAQIGLLQKTDANYHYLYGGIALSQGDQDGVQTVLHLVTQHSAVQTYEGRMATRIFRLAPGTYTASAVLSGGSGGTWQYYTGPSQLWIQGKVWEQ